MDAPSPPGEDGRGPCPTERRQPQAADGYAGPPLDEHDTPAEVDATFRTQRRIAVGYFLVFLVVTLAVPTLTLLLDWWSSGRLLGAMSPSFVMAAAGLYVFFFVLAVAAGTLATAVEERMLGGPAWPGADEDWPVDPGGDEEDDLR